ncbi:MAG: hypothetical protein HON98_09255 [Chloroflexi bacterium]|nr:hypothetical protein [Chloroflexota bacterium]MBT3668973.1 hypothetical protein [Chloroflexota bacterium]MBT4304944.1 hypothetical protein [Chloroflexota bacterium]MBT4533293.1 hypothetical protein [Chloroflexota bacterium]MBT4683651.1 hypothetical protein [Chloroflexota bacterium]
MNNIVKNKHFPIVIIFLFLIIIGLIVVQDYGESWDEKLHIEYGEYTYNNFSSLFTEDNLKFGPENLSYYGPFFDLIITFGTKFIQIIEPDISVIPIRHFFYYFSFLIAAGSIYVISNYLFQQKLSLGITILFITQPVLWGHAFINPKDIPFMAMFLLSIAVGIVTSSKIAPLIATFQVNRETNTGNIFKNEWKTVGNRKPILIWVVIFLSSIILFLFMEKGLNLFVENTIIDLYKNQESFLGTLFAQLAINANEIPVDSYVLKSIAQLKRFFGIYVIMGTLLTLLWIFRLLPLTRKLIWEEKAKPFLNNLLNSLKNPWVLFTGVCVGITTAIRILGPFAGFLVGFYFILLYKQKSIAPIIIMGFIAVLTTYVLWPSLWESPIRHFYKSLTVMSDFPWGGEILLNGELFLSNSLPSYYLPLLMSIQFTEPVVILFVFGILIVSLDIIKKKNNWKIWIIICSWFFLIVFMIILYKPILYDNFRQLLFIIPPIFLITGKALEYIFNKIKRIQGQWLVVTLLLIPGVYSLIDLHPYQYVYYNSFVGGVEGSYRQYETDYWSTSFREASEFLNDYATINSKIVVMGNHLIVKRVARKDLIVEPVKGGTYDFETGYDFAIQSTRWNQDLNNFPNAPIIFTVERDGAVFAVVKQLRCTINNPCP